jgi:hypothetical protein
MNVHKEVIGNSFPDYSEGKKAITSRAGTRGEPSATWQTNRARNGCPGPSALSKGAVLQTAFPAAIDPLRRPHSKG